MNGKLASRETASVTVFLTNPIFVVFVLVVDEEVRLVNPTNPAMAAAPETTLQITPNWATKKRIFKVWQMLLL